MSDTNKNVDLGKKAYIDKIKFIGDKKIKDRKLKRIIASEENKFWKFISNKKFLDKKRINLDEKQISFFSNFFYENSFFSDKFLRVNKALSQGWACWVKLNDTNLDWNLYLQPIDELSQIKEFFSNNKFVFLSALRKDNFFQMYLKKQSLSIDLVINFKSNFEEKKISLYIPSSSCFLIILFLQIQYWITAKS